MVVHSTAREIEQSMKNQARRQSKKLNIRGSRKMERALMCHEEVPARLPYIRGLSFARFLDYPRFYTMLCY